MAALVIWTSFTVARVTQAVPLIFRDGAMSYHFAQFVLSPIHSEKSPSWLRMKAAAATALADACTPTPESEVDPWGWRGGTEDLFRDGGGRHAAILRDNQNFIVHLVLTGVLPVTGVGLAALLARAEARARAVAGGRRHGWLAHISQGASPVRDAQIIRRMMEAAR